MTPGRPTLLSVSNRGQSSKRALHLPRCLSYMNSIQKAQSFVAYSPIFLLRRWFVLSILSGACASGAMVAHAQDAFAPPPTQSLSSSSASDAGTVPAYGSPVTGSCIATARATPSPSQSPARHGPSPTPSTGPLNDRLHPPNLPQKSAPPSERHAVFHQLLAVLSAYVAVGLMAPGESAGLTKPCPNYRPPFLVFD